MNEFNKLFTLKEALLLFYSDAESRLHQKTILNYKTKMKAFLEFIQDKKALPLERIYMNEISRKDMESYQKYLRQKSRFKNHPTLPKTSAGISNNTIRDYITKLNIFFRFCLVNGYMDYDIVTGIKLIRPEKKDKLPLYQSEVDLMNARYQNRSESNYRNLCILHLMLDAGLRPEEVVKLKLKDINFDKGYLYVDNSKGYKSRYIRISRRLKNYLVKYKTCYRGSGAPGDSFLLQVGTRNQITHSSIKMVFERLKKTTGIDRLYPYLCRHTFASSFLLGGGNLESLRVLMGHSDISTTQQYLHISNQYGTIADDIYRLDSGFLDVYYKK